MALANHANPGLFGRQRWLVWTLGLLALVVILASFMMRDDPVPVRAVEAERATIRSVISTNGKIEPVRSFEAHAPVGTTVKKLLVKEGDRVKKGQLLAVLNDAEVRNQAAKALAQVKSSESDLHVIQSGGTQEEVLTTDSQLTKVRTDRDTAQHNLAALQRLQEKGAASAGEVKEAQNQLQRAEADLKLLEEKQKDRYSKPEVARVEAQKDQAQSAFTAAQDVLSQMNIRAPFDAVIYSLPVREGAYVNPGDMVLQGADLSKVLVRAFVDEPDVGRLTTGQKVEVTWDALPGRTWTGTVSSTPASVKLRGTRTVGETTSIVDNDDLKLLPNIDVGVAIVTAEHTNALTVPREAVRQSDEKIYVFQVVNDQLVRRDIKVAISNLTSAEVTDGLPDKAMVALNSTVASKPLRNGMAIRVTH